MSDEPLDELLRSALDGLAPPEGLATRIEASLRRRRRKQWVALLAAAAAVLLALWLWPGRPEAPRTRQFKLSTRAGPPPLKLRPARLPIELSREDGVLVLHFNPEEPQ